MKMKNENAFLIRSLPALYRRLTMFLSIFSDRFTCCRVQSTHIAMV